jgi:hypothetical protein
MSLPVVHEDKPPARFVRAIDRDIPERVVMFWQDDGTPVLRRPFSGDENSALQQRRSELLNTLTPWPETRRDPLLAKISGMLGGFPTNQRHDPETALVIAAGYLWVVRERPAWAIIRACHDIREGQAGFNREFPPSEAQFNWYIGRLVEQYEQMLRQTELLLSAKIEAPPSSRPTQGEIEAKLQRPLGAAATYKDSKAAPSPAYDGKHALRVLDDLEARKARRILQATLRRSPRIAIYRISSWLQKVWIATKNMQVRMRWSGQTAAAHLVQPTVGRSQGKTRPKA